MLKRYVKIKMKKKQKNHKKKKIIMKDNKHPKRILSIYLFMKNDILVIIWFLYPYLM